MDNFKGQTIPAINQLLEHHDIHVALMPPNCIDQLQLIGVAVNSDAQIIGMAIGTRSISAINSRYWYRAFLCRYIQICTREQKFFACVIVILIIAPERMASRKKSAIWSFFRLLMTVNMVLQNM